MANVKLITPVLIVFGVLAVASSGYAQQEAFMTADKNADTMLDQPEFKVFIDTMAASGKPIALKVKQAGRYNLAFGRIDKDKNGLLTPNELQSLK
ncbi:Ca2+-binding EF-hand superfamily protein [Rhizobium soli]|uniref:Ca2+-binding EF-hand superfamily protein n=1 Tax=Rhizobium soli TaxID=424798 RepID=A0A7X0JN95_9HYPH|nr:hypothetical protein [Rhizobium soli]MBB6510745.1 Ca2+-binding EF-hand superfamily protein [Rhizobium soli]